MCIFLQNRSAYDTNVQVVILPWYCLPLTHKVILCYICIRVPRGSGWQDIGAYVNLEAYYLVGFPVGVVLAFGVHLKGKGLCIEKLTGSTVEAFLLDLKTIFTNWEKHVTSTHTHTQFYLSIYLVLFLHLSTTKFHVQLDHIVWKLRTL